MDTTNYSRLTVNERINLKSWYFLCQMPLITALRVTENYAWKMRATPQTWYKKLPARCLPLHAKKHA